MCLLFLWHNKCFLGVVRVSNTVAQVGDVVLDIVRDDGLLLLANRGANDLGYVVVDARIAGGAVTRRHFPTRPFAHRALPSVCVGGGGC